MANIYKVNFDGHNFRIWLPKACQRHLDVSPGDYLIIDMIEGGAVLLTKLLPHTLDAANRQAHRLRSGHRAQRPGQG